MAEAGSSITANMDAIRSAVHVASQGNPMTDAALRSVTIAGLALLEGYLYDQRRIADALDRIAVTLEEGLDQ